MGRRLTAIALAQAALCEHQGCARCRTCERVAAGQHPDCQVLLPTPPAGNPKGTLTLRIEQIRELEHAAALAPHEAGRKVFILDEAERMTLPTAQALLKTLEEPPPRTHLILVLASLRTLPPTLLSRCQRVRFRPLDDATLAELLAARGVEASAGRVLARLTQGRPGAALGTDLETLRARRQAAVALAGTPPARLAGALDAVPVDRASVAAYLEVLGLWYRDALCLAAGAPESLLVNVDEVAAVRALAEAGRIPGLLAALARIRAAWLALDANVNPRLALENALLDSAAA